MENSLISYFGRRLQSEAIVSKLMHPPGPVITISREIGCNGLKLARELANNLNQDENPGKWKVISKEILYESAKELHLEPERVRNFLKQSDRYTLDEILNTFSYKHFVSERKIINTVVEVIHSFAVDGFCIIVGRAGNIIAKDIKNSLHIKLIASLEYRIENVMNNNLLNRLQAIEFIQRVENERLALRKSVAGEGDKDVYSNFDLIINRASFTTEEIVDVILSTLKTKNILAEYSRKATVY